MSELLTLAGLAELAGERGDFELGKKQGPYKSPFELNKAYPVSIAAQEVGFTKTGFNQVVIDVEATTGAKSKFWFCLPVFTEEKEAATDASKVVQLEQIFTEKFHNLLRAVNPEIFGFLRMEKIGGKWCFFDSNGDSVSKEDQKAHNKMLAKATIAVAGQIRDGDYDLTGSKCFYVRTQNIEGKVDARTGQPLTYDNFYATAPDKYEVAGV